MPKPYAYTITTVGRTPKKYDPNRHLDGGKYDALWGVVLAAVIFFLLAA
jgi:hypothetical protein